MITKIKIFCTKSPDISSLFPLTPAYGGIFYLPSPLRGEDSAGRVRERNNIVLKIITFVLVYASSKAPPEEEIEICPLKYPFKISSFTHIEPQNHDPS
jgi:hypothetical protein